MGFGDICGPKPYKFMGLRDMHGPGEGADYHSPKEIDGFGPFRIRGLKRSWVHLGREVLSGP